MPLSVGDARGLILIMHQWNMGPRRAHAPAREVLRMPTHGAGTWTPVDALSGSTPWGRVWLGHLEALFLYPTSIALRNAILKKSLTFQCRHWKIAPTKEPAFPQKLSDGSLTLVPAAITTCCCLLQSFNGLEQHLAQRFAL